jgi:hypothetical protein
VNQVTSKPSNQTEFEFDLSRVGLLVVFPVACWAYYTTFQGLVDITRQGPNDSVGVIGALIGSAAILTMMALTSWLLGADLAAALANRRRGSSMKNITVLTITFLFFFGLSSFFSYTYYHANFFGLSSKRITGESQAMDLAAEIVPALDSAIIAANKTSKDAALNSPGSAEWLVSVDELIKKAGAGGANFFDEITKINKTKQAEQQDADAQRIKQAQEQQRNLEAAKTKIQDLQRDIGTQQTVIAKLEGDQAKLDAEAKTEDAEAQKSEVGLDSSKIAKCGPICGSHKEKARVAREGIKKIDNLLKGPRKLRDDKQAELDALQRQLPGLQGAASAPAPGPRVDKAATLPDISQLPDRLSAAARRFREDPTWTTLRTAKADCEVLLGAARQLKGIQLKLSPTFECLPQDDATRRLLDTRETAATAWKQYKNQCALDGALGNEMKQISERVRSREMAPTEALNAGKKFVDDCIAKAGSAGIPSDQLRAFYQSATNFVRNNTLERNRFEMATDALAKFDVDARKALAVALAQDLLILLYKFVSDNYRYRSRSRRFVSTGAPIDLSDRKNDQPEIRARKMLLRLAAPGRGDACWISENDIATAQVPPDVIENLRGLLNTLARQGAAWADKKGVQAIDNAAIAQIEAELRNAGTSSFGEDDGAGGIGPSATGGPRIGGAKAEVEGAGSTIRRLEPQRRATERRGSRGGLSDYISSARVAEDSASYRPGSAQTQDDREKSRAGDGQRQGTPTSQQSADEPDDETLARLFKRMGSQDPQS